MFLGWTIRPQLRTLCSGSQTERAPTRAVDHGVSSMGGADRPSSVGATPTNALLERIGTGVCRARHEDHARRKIFDARDTVPTEAAQGLDHGRRRGSELT
jgi:hypothetical protein